VSLPAAEPITAEPAEPAQAHPVWLCSRCGYKPFTGGTGEIAAHLINEHGVPAMAALREARGPVETPPEQRPRIYRRHHPRRRRLRCRPASTRARATRRSRPDPASALRIIIGPAARGTSRPPGVAPGRRPRSPPRSRDGVDRRRPRGSLGRNERCRPDRHPEHRSAATMAQAEAIIGLARTV
jgi:hypothetical protein